jgi:hypothetical protein
MVATVPASIKIIHCVLCDDVRIELGYKEIIIGVYSGGITVPMLPWTGLLCAWLTVIWSGEGTLDLEIRVLDPTQQSVGTVSGSGTAILVGAESTLTLRGLIIQIEMEGYYTIQWRVAGGVWASLRQLPIYALRDAATIVP